MRILLLLLILPFIASSQTTEPSFLEGRVFETTQTNGVSEQKPLWGANVYWHGTTIGTATDEKGFFQLQETSESSDLVASFVGYDVDSVWINSDGINIRMLASTLEVVEVNSRQKSTGLSMLDPMKTELITETELLKAACCNLSESFETNPSVDVSFTDAVTGTRQIIMLGLAGPYTQINREGIPLIRGLTAVNGLTYVPGTWIQSMQLNKGTGSVVNGFESIAGQINLEYRKPDQTDRLYFNLYGNEGGRVEANLHFSHRIKDTKWATAALVHAKDRRPEIDRNNDGFLDNLISNQVILLNRWKYTGTELRAQFGINYSNINEIGGQLNFDPETDALTQNRWGLHQQVEKWDAWAKIGRVFTDQPWKTFGFQLNAIDYDHSSYFGLNTYSGSQQGFYSNFIYQTIIGNTKHKVSTGANFALDTYDENFYGLNYDRTEYTPGTYFEYTYSGTGKFSAVSGIRADYNNIYGAFITPRVHIRYAPEELTVIRASAGRGQRTANIMAEHMGILASSRALIIQGNSDGAYGLDAEVAWNFGANFSRGFIIYEREAMFTVDLYRTQFQNQVILNLENPDQAVFSNLDGKSRSNSLQVQFDYEVLPRFDVRVAYRWFDNKSTFDGAFLEQPLIAAHLAFINLGYATNNEWKFDFTLSTQSKKRIPFTGSNPVEYQLEPYSPGFFQLNTQISKGWKDGQFEVYAGAENLLNYRQDNPILGANDPFGPNFDASLIWGPVFGRTVYAGLRYRLAYK
ncbi:MAG: outer membrane receptor for ferrienterochelin and colicins [Limisphaerales bacterium]|jgi:outer membrane receptor for ferrienterochelin and colicins